MICDLCQPSPHEVLWQDDFCRVVLLNDADYPTYCRVELIAHIKEMTDLAPADRARMMAIVFAVETAMIEVINPDKINLASLGNKTPHLHWHIIPRFADDKHFPNSHWGAVVRGAVVKSAVVRGEVVRGEATAAGLQANIHGLSKASLLMFKEKVIANIGFALTNNS